MNKKIFINAIIIIIARVLDLVTTYFATSIDFIEQEQNILVKFFNLNFFQFCLIESLLAILLIFINIYSIKNSKEFDIKSDNLWIYIKLFFHKKKLNLKDFLTKTSFKESLILFGSIIPQYILITSVIFSINNIIVYLFINGIMVKTYTVLNSYYFWDFIIFVLPLIILSYLLYSKLKTEYYDFNNDEPSMI